MSARYKKKKSTRARTVAMTALLSQMLFLISMVLVFPADALACPACAAGSGSTHYFWWLAGMVLIPYPVVMGVVWTLRRIADDEKSTLKQFQTMSEETKK